MLVYNTIEIKIYVKGVLYPEIYFFIINFFIILNSHMCIYTLKKQTCKQISNKLLQGGCATPPNVPKLGVSGVKDTAKTNKD